MTAEIIISPLLEFISKIIKKHITKLQKKMKIVAKQGKTCEIVKIAKNIESLTEFIINTKNNDLQQEIIKRISRLFSLDIKKYSNLITCD